MAHYIGNQQKAAGSTPASNDHSSNPLTERSSLEEIREIVTSNGCTKAQFDHAKEAVGHDPYHVAIYLQRFTFKKVTKLPSPHVTHQ
jgi:hypothetical protein